MEKTKQRLRDTYPQVEKLEDYLNIEITDNDWTNKDLEITEWNTADGYEIYVMSEDSSQLNWENDVYYYKPDTETVLERIEQASLDFGEGARILIYDIEEHLPEDEVEDWINSKTEEDE